MTQLTKCSYAHLYDLRTICCFDGAYLLVLWWPYASTGDVKDEEPEHWLFPVNSRFTLKEVVYRLLIEGIRRVLGANRMLQADQGNHSRPFGGWILIRDHRGRIFWRDPQGKNHWEHPKLKKQLDISNQRWVWLATTRNGEQVVHEEPNALWDIGS